MSLNALQLGGAVHHGTMQSMVLTTSDLGQLRIATYRLVRRSDVTGVATGLFIIIIIIIIVIIVIVIIVISILKQLVEPT